LVGRLGPRAPCPLNSALIKGATTISKLGVQLLSLGYYYPFTEKIRQV